MKTWMKILLALVLTAVMLSVTTRNSRGRPEFYSHEENGFYVEMTTVPKVLEGTVARWEVKVVPPDQDEFSVFMRVQIYGYGGKDIGDKERVIRMQPVPDKPDVYFLEQTAFPKGGRLLYMVQVVDWEGTIKTQIVPEGGGRFVHKYIGHVPAYIIIPHIVFIFATVFFVSLATANAIPLIREKTDDARPLAVCMFWAVVFTFLGCYPFGIPMNWFAFGATWEGVPFGTDATDNKTQLLFVYLLFVMLTGLGSLTKGRFGCDLYAPKTLGWLGISSAAFLLFIYLIPHSIQFSAAVTYSVCYSVIGLTVVAYLFSFMRAVGAGKSR